MADKPAAEPLKSESPPPKPTRPPGPMTLRAFVVTGPGGPASIAATDPKQAESQYRAHFGTPAASPVTVTPDK